MKFYSEKEVYAMLSMEECIDAMREAFQLLHAHISFHALRKRVHLPGGTIGWGNLLSMMPAYYDENYCGAKIFTVYPDNTGTALPTHQGLVLLFDSHNGSLIACGDANAITELRTAATTALATDYLARKDARSLAFIGAGAQAHSHLPALMAVRDFKEIYICDKISERTENLAALAREKYGLKAIVCPDIHSAAISADVICSATTSNTPLLSLADIKEGAHINAVGACAPIFRELSSDIVCSSRFFGDHREAVYNEAGDFIIPMQEGHYDESFLKGDLSDLAGGMAGRSSDSDITIFKSLGIANEDVAALKRIYEKDCASQP